MKEFIDKLIERLEEAKVSANRRNAFDSEVSYSCAIEIVIKLAEEYKEECDLDCDKLLFAYSDLLKKFQNAEESVICEFSGNISKEIEELEEDCNELLSQFKEILYSVNSPKKSAEEYKVSEMPTGSEDYCEWKKGESSVFPIKTNCGNSIDVNYGYEFCPYCGKKIKVAPYTEGE